MFVSGEADVDLEIARKQQNLQRAGLGPASHQEVCVLHWSAIVELLELPLFQTCLIELLS